MLRSGRVALALTCLLSACAGRTFKRPYAPGQAPDQSALLALSKPQIQAIQVGKASVTLNRALRGSMAFIAQVPGRFRGGVSFAGAELVTLALSENGYQLRSIKGDLPPGFYEGPPDECAVQALLGVTIGTDALVSLLLGGIPLIDTPYQVMGQKWSRKNGWEVIVVRNARYIEELRYGWIDSAWQFVGGALWERRGDDKGRRLWRIEHKSMVRVGDAYLPSRTLVSTPGKRKDDRITIVYKDRDTNPAFARQSVDAGEEDGGDDDDDVWGDDDGGGWEDEGGEDGWEDESETPTAATPATPEVPSTETPAQAPATPRSAVTSSAPAPKPNASTTIPQEFQLVPGSLARRGDLCRPAARAGSAR